ncbi:MAG: hypothetical protein KAI83_14650 [Thiomargarita sp.]|nr:hypothetical protein [Thiomargarita sp.]
MNTMIKVLVISIIFFITPVCASESGLLLGLRYSGYYDSSATIAEEKNALGKQFPSSYRTFWIRAENGQVELAAERTNLLVPRRDGFWRLDVKHSVYNDFSEDFIWVNPAPDQDAISNPFLAEQEGIDAFDVSLLIKEQGIDITHGEYCKGYTSRDILFIGNNHLSIGLTHNEICRGFSIDSTIHSALQMLSLEKLEPIEITTLLNTKHRNLFKNAAKSYQDKNTGIKEWGEVSGGIMRHQGRWIIKGHFPINAQNFSFSSNSLIPNNAYTHFDVPISAPKGLIFYNELYPNWRTIKKHVPDAIDAFSSQAKDLLVVLTDAGHLLAFTLEDDKISKEPALHILFKQPITVVMARWAEGQFVSNWTQEIQNLGPKPQESWFSQVEMSDIEEPVKTIGVVITPTLNIRQGLWQHTKPIAKVKKGLKINILDVLGQLYKVQLDNMLTGYVHSDYVKILPKLPYVQQACPSENCSYGEWKLKESALFYTDPSFNANSLMTLKAGQTVQALHGEIHTSQFGEIEVIKSQIELADDNQKLILYKGDRLFDLEPVGLDMHIVWYNGNIYYLNNAWNSEVVAEDQLWGKAITKRKTDWWVKVNVPEKNISGWIVNPEIEAVK